MDDQTIDFILTDNDKDPVSNVPFAAVVYMLYYGLELKNFLTEISDEMVDKFDLSKHEVGEYSIYRSGSVAQGFYLTTNYLPDARDIDVVAISHRYDVRERCNYNEEEDNVKNSNEIVLLENELHEDKVKNRKDSCIVTGQCGENDGPYFNVKVFPDTPPGYVLIERCRRHRKAEETHKERFVSSLKATEARVKFWSDLQPLIKQKFDGTGETIGDQESSLFSFVEPHGPAATTFMSLFESTTSFETDFVYCVPYPKRWPEIAADFLTRERKSDWPSNELINQIFRDGCTLIPKGELDSKTEDYEWRISFTGELRLARSLNRTQRELIHAFKALISERQHPYDLLDISTSIESYHLLTLMYHESELADPSFWIPQNIAKMMFKLMDKYLEHFEMRYLSHFMISSRNIFAKYRDMSEEEADSVLYTILRLRRDPVGQIVQQEKYLNLPGYLHKWAFDPVVNGLKLNVNQKLHPIMYVHSLLRLSKAHLLVKHFDKALIYARDAQRFFSRIAEKDTTAQDFIDLNLTLAICLQRNGENTEAIRATNTLRETIVKGEDTLDRMTLELFYRLSARFRFYEYVRNSPKTESDLSFMSDYMKIFAISQYSQDISVEGMYAVMITGGPDKMKEVAESLDRHLPDMFEDIVNAEDVKVIYDRKEQVCLKGGLQLVISSETNEARPIEQMNGGIDDQPTAEELLWTAFRVKSDPNNDLRVKNQRDAKATTDEGELGGCHIRNEEATDLQTKCNDGTGTSASWPVTKVDEQLIDSESMKEMAMNGLSEEDMEISVITDTTSETMHRHNGITNNQLKIQEEIIYDRKRFLHQAGTEQLRTYAREYADMIILETNETDDEFTDADVNMVDARFVEELCRVKLFSKLDMQVKADEILQRLKSKIKSARETGRKVSLKMVERALELYIETARAMSKTEGEVNDIIDKKHIYFSLVEKPYLDKILQEAFNKVGVKVLVLPVEIVLFHTKLLFFTRKNMFEEAEAVFRKTETFIESLEDVADRKVSECILELQRNALSEHFCQEIHLSGDFEYETNSRIEEFSVKKQVFRWIEAVFETMKRYEPRNKYLDEVFTNG